jgi:hypothetical protein
MSPIRGTPRPTLKAQLFSKDGWYYMQIISVSLAQIHYTPTSQTNNTSFPQLSASSQESTKERAKRY